jgi:hypothetical protein
MNASADALRETKGKAMITWTSKWVALRTQTSVAAKGTKYYKDDDLN